MRRPAAALALALLIAEGLVALLLGTALTRDNHILIGFAELYQPPYKEIANVSVHAVDVEFYVLAALALSRLALRRGRRRLALRIPLAMAASSVSAELLKSVIRVSRSAAWVGGGPGLKVGSWPSGHSAAAMSIALGAVLVAPPARRAWVALFGAILAIGVGYAVLILGWHLPSDVLGGYLLAAFFMALAADAADGPAPARSLVGPLAAGVALALVCALAAHGILATITANASFDVGALAIGLAGALIVSGSALAPRAAHRPRWPRARG